MRIILLTNNVISKPVFDFIASKGNEVLELQIPITADIVKEINPDFVISYNYRHIVKKDVIELLGDRIINMHISMLPWNKGADPNVWSFLDNTPKGVTIHKLTEKLDDGDILLQQSVSFDTSKETLASSYNRLHETIQTLLFSNWEQVYSGNIVSYRIGQEGTRHKSKEFEKIKYDMSDIFSWDMIIDDFVKQYNLYREA